MKRGTVCLCKACTTIHSGLDIPGSAVLVDLRLDLYTYFLQAAGSCWELLWSPQDVGLQPQVSLSKDTLLCHLLELS